MKLTFAHDRLLAVMAHPDDAELLCAGTLARAKTDGAAVAILILCRGDKGAGAVNSGAANAGSARADLAELRQSEAAEAAELLGARLFWFGAGDGELFDSTETRTRLIEIFRQFRPTLVIAHAAEDYHPDHRAASSLAEAASWFCASRGHATDSPALDAPPRLWFADTLNMSGFSPQFFINVADQVELKRRMLSCHRSQLDRSGDGDFAPLVELMARQCAARGAQARCPAAEAFRWHQAFKRTGAF